ncbi:MAG TPA: hypothetical protein VFA02_03075 [Pseudacidobacterium sp.]|nr:hypothetical protein [Pseudacidobacterium sp.]
MKESIRGPLVNAACSPLLLRNRFSGFSVVHPESNVVVSLTTHGVRLKTAHVALESIGRGTVKPSRLILWIDKEDAAHGLPSTIQRLQKRGLEVMVSDGKYGPHTKYYPYLKSTQDFTAPLVTADDDIVYPKWWLRDLLEAYHKNPRVVNCHRAHVVVCRNGKIASYSEWQSCTTVEERFENFATGVSGVIYPPEFQRVLFQAGDGFQQCCPWADDVWLHVQALRAGYKVRQVREKPAHFWWVPATGDSALMHRNVLSARPGNDDQIAATYTDADVQTILTGSVVSTFTAARP